MIKDNFVLALLIALMITSSIGGVAWLIMLCYIKDSWREWIELNIWRSSSHTVYYTILNEHVFGTPKDQTINKLTSRFKLRLPNALLLYEIAMLGEKEWFEEAYLTKDGIYGTSQPRTNR